MFGIRYMKAPPTAYVLHYKSGQVVREGAGLSFLYFAPTSILVSVPLASVDVPFVFNEMSADFQAVTIQGQLTFRVTDAKRLAGLLDFSIGGEGEYRSEDPDKLKNRLIHTTQILTRAIIQRTALRAALLGSEPIVKEVLAGLKTAESVQMLGVEVLSLSILSIAPTPEMSKALEAEAREELQRKADQAIYARRNAAVAEERKIKESELNTAIAVEEKQREIREKKMAAEIAVEQQRVTLLQRQVENDRKAADARAYALETTLKPLKEMDWRTLLAVSPSGGDSRLQIALAFRELAENAQKIGELNVSPDLLRTLLSTPGK